MLVTGHDRRRFAAVQPEAVRASRCGGLATRQQGRSEGQDRDPRHGKTQLVPGVVCDQKNRKQLIACLQPHRRAEVEVIGEIVVRVNND